MENYWRYKIKQREENKITSIEFSSCLFHAIVHRPQKLENCKERQQVLQMLSPYKTLKTAKITRCLHQYLYLAIAERTSAGETSQATQACNPLLPIYKVEETKSYRRTN
jgi:hypothetical protein